MSPSKHECAVSPALNRLLPVHETSSDIVLLQRSNTRIFAKETLDMLYSQLSKKGRVVIYYGTETPLNTVRIFQKARYLVGYHGAGLVNAYFMQNSTCILEISTFTDLNNSRPWRSNMKEVTKYGTFDAQVLRIPIQQLLNSNRVKYRARDTDHFVKKLKYVTLTDNDVRTIVEFQNGSGPLEP